MVLWLALVVFKLLQTNTNETFWCGISMVVVISYPKYKTFRCGGVVVVVCCYFNLWYCYGFSKVKIKTFRCGGVVVWCGGGFFTDYNTTLRLHWLHRLWQGYLMLRQKNLF